MHPLIARYTPYSFQWFARYWRRRLAGHIERELSAFVALARPGSIAVDAGANVGVVSYLLARRGAKVHAFEPIPECASMVRTIAGVEVHQVALSDQEATVTMHAPSKDGLASGMASVLPVPDAQAETTLTVSARTLDSFELRDVSVIKIDVEGHEMAVIAGASRTLARERPALLVEIEFRRSGKPVEEAVSSIEELGYRGEFLDAQGSWQSARTFDPAKHGVPGSPDYIYNFIFKPK